MSRDEIKKRERKIRSNFTSIVLLMTAIGMVVTAGVLLLIETI
jgi:hypothetical protein